MSEMVINTVQFRFPAASPRPSLDEVAQFLKQLNTDVQLMQTAYRTAQDRSLFIKFVSLEAMKEALSKNTEPRTFVYASGQSVEVCMATAGTNVRYVRVFDLPPEVNDERLSLVLGEYGKVEHVVREKFSADSGLGHMYTGVRGVYLDVKKDIPPAIDVIGRKGRIFYDGLKDTCFLCQKVGHRRDDCPQRRNNPRKKKQENSYAGVVSGNEAVPVERNSAPTPEDEIVEILEEEVADPSGMPAADQVQEAVCKQKADSEEERRRKSMDILEEAAKKIKDVMHNPEANQRRAQFAAAGSGSSSTSGSRPKKKCARKTYY